MHTLEPRIQLGPWLTTPDAGERPNVWVLFAPDGTIVAVWRRLESAERDLIGMDYTVHLGAGLTRGPVTEHPFSRALRYLMARIITPIR